MKNFLLILCMGLFLTSCISSKKAYNYVVTDTFRNNDERAKLSKAYIDEFPNYRDTPRVTTVFDSSAYSEYLANENALLDQVIMAYDIIDSLQSLQKSSDTVKPLQTKPRFSPGDSARAVKNYLAQRKPPPIEKNVTTDTPIINDGRIAEKEKELSDCREENNKLSARTREAEDKLSDKKKTNIWLWVILGLSAAGNALLLLNKAKIIR